MSDKKKSNLEDLLVDLDFVPDWAREKPGTAYPAQRERRERERDSGHRGPRREGRRPPRDRGDHRGRPKRKFIERAPVRVDFLPENDRLVKVVQTLRASKRAYPLSDLGRRFMEKPPLFAVKLQTMVPKEGGEEATLYQCPQTRAAFLDREACMEHACTKALELFFEVEEREVEPPAGNFPGVAKCTLGGELIGPPNHHSYNPAVEALRKKSYPDMDPEAFRRHIEVDSSEEAIEAWKQTQTVEKVYREKGVEEPDSLTALQATQLLRSKYADKVVEETHRAVMPGTVAWILEDERLHFTVHQMMRKEQQRPFSILLALRPALKHMRFYIFRAGKSEAFVTSVKPRPIRAEDTVEEIRKVLEYVRTHPGCSREEMIEQLLPGTALDSEPVKEVVKSLRWLVDKGHVIEFFDGTLTVPKG